MDERQSAAQTAQLKQHVEWLEDQLRDTRAQMAKLVQALEQANAQIWELTSRQLRSEETIGGILPQLPAIPHLDVRLGQLKDQLAGVQEHGLGLAQRHTELSRQVDATAERDRLYLNELSHRLDAVERTDTALSSRLDALEEAHRRTMETATLLRQRIDEAVRGTESFESRLTRVSEAMHRSDQDIQKLAQEMVTLFKQDEQLDERVQVYLEMTKRLEGQIAVVASDVAVKQDVIERIDLARVEIHRLEERIAGYDTGAETLRDEVTELERLVTSIEGRQKGITDRLSGLLADAAEHRVQVNDQFQRLYSLNERLQRRRIEDMERELRDLKIHAFRAAEEQ